MFIVLKWHSNLNVNWMSDWKLGCKTAQFQPKWYLINYKTDNLFIDKLSSIPFHTARSQHTLQWWPSKYYEQCPQFTSVFHCWNETIDLSLTLQCSDWFLLVYHLPSALQHRKCVANINDSNDILWLSFLQPSGIVDIWDGDLIKDRQTICPWYDTMKWDIRVASDDYSEQMDWIRLNQI